MTFRGTILKSPVRIDYTNLNNSKFNIAFMDLLDVACIFSVDLLNQYRMAGSGKKRHFESPFGRGGSYRATPKIC